MLKIVFFSLFYLNILFAQNPPYAYQASQLKTTASGLKYHVVQAGTGAQINAGDIVSVHYHGMLENGKVFDSSFERNDPLDIQIGVGKVIKGWDEALPLFKVGTKAVLVIPPALGYGSNDMGVIPPNSTLIFHIEVKSIKPKPKTPTPTPPNPPFQYDESKAIQTASGLKYVIVKEGKGTVPKAGEQITAWYHGLFADGKKFDSAYDRGQPFVFKVGVGQVIRGWDEAFTTLKRGTKAVLIIPPDLGYGANGAGSIPPNATLYFHVELYDENESNN